MKTFLCRNRRQEISWWVGRATPCAPRRSPRHPATRDFLTLKALSLSDAARTPGGAHGVTRPTLARNLILAAFVLIACSPSAFAQGTKSNPTPLPQEKIDAAALLKDIVGRAPQEFSETLGSLNIRDGEGKLRKVPIKWNVRPGTNEWTDTYQTAISGKVPPEVLVVTHREGQPNKYEFSRGEIPKLAVTTNIYVPFATSDFWLADFGLEFFRWPNPKHIKTEMRKSRACYVVQSLNPIPDNGPYGSVLSWIDTEKGGLIRAEAYDAKGKLLKEFSIKDFTKVNGRWQLKGFEIRNEQTDSKTSLEFNLEVSDR